MKHLQLKTDDEQCTRISSNVPTRMSSTDSDSILLQQKLIDQCPPESNSDTISAAIASQSETLRPRRSTLLVPSAKSKSWKSRFPHLPLFFPFTAALDAPSRPPLGLFPLSLVNEDSNGTVLVYMMEVSGSVLTGGTADMESLMVQYE